MPISRPYPVFVLFVAVAVASTLFMTGCGGNNITENEAAGGFRAASKPLQKGQRKTQKKLQKLFKELGKPAQKFLAGENTITHVTECTEAGDVKFSVSYDRKADTGEKLNMGANFRGCEAEQRIETNGQLDIDSPQFSGIGVGSGGNSDSSDSCNCPEPTTITYKGDLDWSGKVDGPCQVDLEAEIPPWGQPSYSGDLCGYEASNVLGGF